MTISEIVDVEVLTAIGIVETVPEFDNTQRNFKLEQEVRDGDFIYKFAKDDFYAEDFDSSSTSYNLYDVVHNDGKLHYISSNVVGTVALQPEEYSSVDTSPKPALWGNRYLKVGTFSNDRINIVVDNYQYTFTESGGDITTTILVTDSESEVKYESTDTTCQYIEGDIGSTASLWTGKCDNTYDLDTADFQIGVYYYVPDLDITVKAVENIEYNQYSYVEVTATEVHSSTITALPSSNLTIAETMAVKVNDYEFVPYTYILRGDDLYLRTYVDASWQTKDVSDIEIELLEHVYTVDWGFVKYRPTDAHAPFDDAKNTVTKATNTIGFLVKLNGDADVIATNNMIASDVNIYRADPRYDPENYGVLDLTTGEVSAYLKGTEYPLHLDGGNIGVGVWYLTDSTNHRVLFVEEQNRTDTEVKFSIIVIDSPDQSFTINPTARIGDKTMTIPTTNSFYLDEEHLSGRYIYIEIKPYNNVVQVGEIVCANRKIAGFTDLVFSNSIKDMSPLNEDQWGNIEYERTIVRRIFTGTAQIKIEEYDVVGALLYNIAGNKVVLDGNDNTDNKEVDSIKVFSSAQIIGRLKVSDQKTIVRNGRIDDYATYSFTVTEDV